jgi:protein-disulfide isomerase
LVRFGSLGNADSDVGLVVQRVAILGARQAVLVLWHVPHDWRLPTAQAAQPIGLPPTQTVGLVFGGFLGLGVLVAGQLLSKASEPEVEVTTVAPIPEASSPAAQPAGATSKPAGAGDSPTALPTDLSEFFPAPEPGSIAGDALPRRISLIGGKAVVDVRRTPLLGRVDAEIVIVELFDYTCPHCRQMHRYLSEARKRYGGRLAVAVLVTPMDPGCNRYVHEPATEPGSCDLARLAVVVWQTRPAAFAAFHDWLMESTETRSLEAARARVIEILGGGVLEGAADVLDRALADEAITRQIEADNRIYQLAGAGTIPKLLTDRLMIAGQPSSAAKLFDVLDKQVGLEPVDAGVR